MKVAIVQINSTPNLEDNFNKIVNYLQDVKNNGVDIVFFPENSLYIGSIDQYSEIVEKIETIYFEKLKNIIKQYQITTVIGSIPVKSKEGKFYNRQYFFNKDGEIKNFYDKIHLFQIDDKSSSLNETSYVTAGNSIKIVEYKGYKIGLTICYDLRFPELYRKLIDNGVDIVNIASAFTYKTGKKHWEILLRARAIENQIYVIAPNQVGTHNNNNISYGFSSIVEPEGNIFHLDSKNEGVLYHNISKDKIERYRKWIPALKNRAL